VTAVQFKISYGPLKRFIAALHNGSFGCDLENGSVVTWPRFDCGDSTGVQDRLRNVQQLGLTVRAFAAILADGSVVTWGKLNFGGDSTAEFLIGHSMFRRLVTQQQLLRPFRQTEVWCHGAL